MANISNAFGTVTLTTDTKETLYNFLLLHKEFEKDSYYYTEFDTDKNSENELKDLIENNTIEENNQVSYTTTFIALGRWSFESNVRWLMDTIKNDYNTSTASELRDKIKQHEITITFQFTDAEQGCDFIGTGTASATWDGETATYGYDVDTSLPYTVENCLEYEIYDEGEIVSINYLINHFDDFFSSKHDKMYRDNKEKIIEVLKTLDYRDSVYYDIDELISDYEDLDNLVGELEHEAKNTQPT